ncbi:hypothetical protein NC653_032980 [Populus alba x Populus x berolinensis]|uniref:Beta-fructofuranosidase n=1 Tax=Populus alba x Populus x berolinensis TaxID=444605 RepID=A0AAD6PYK6_9ROSI|nr:hypothetical protein NC653_032980 [Populus alba x Populus x berolinensis]
MRPLLCPTDKPFSSLSGPFHLAGASVDGDSRGVLPASFKVLYDSDREKETLLVDFGASAIGRVAPVDSGFWWIILLRSYIKRTRDCALLDRPEVQRGMELILKLCLLDGFDTFPTLLCADGCCMMTGGCYEHQMQRAYPLNLK